MTTTRDGSRDQGETIVSLEMDIRRSADATKSARLIVRNPSDEMRAVLIAAGYTTVDAGHVYVIDCTTNEQVNAARAVLLPYRDPSAPTINNRTILRATAAR